MTLPPKELGLADLAEPAYPYYPVKRRGQKRVLNPDWRAINALEQDQAEDCEIDYIQTQSEDGPEAGLAYTFAYGRHAKTYPRPMFQVIHDEAFSGFRGISGTPCSCGDFSRTVTCPDHPELPWDPARRRWIRPCTGDEVCECDTCRQARVVTYTEPEPPAETNGLFDRLMEMYGQMLPEPSPRPNAYYDTSPRNPFVQLTNSARHDPETCPTCVWIRRATGSTLREQESLSRAVQDLRPTHITIEGVFDEGSFTYELEDGSDGRL
jgi:hypothetical protein